VLRRFRHLVVFVGSFLAVLLAVRLATVDRPRPFGVELRGSWGGWAMPSRPVAIFAATLVGVLYTLVPVGRWRQLGKWIATGLVAVFALARVHLGVDAPTDAILGAVIGVAVSVVAYRLFVPNEIFPVSYKRGRSAHLDVGGRRGEAIRQALADQLGLSVLEVEPFGLSGSAGSTPLRLKVQDQAGNPRYVFGKLYAKSHLRADRSYKLGRALLYGRLEDEKPFNTVKRLVQQEDYALCCAWSLGGCPTPRSPGCCSWVRPPSRPTSTGCWPSSACGIACRPLSWLTRPAWWHPAVSRRPLAWPATRTSPLPRHVPARQHGQSGPRQGWMISPAWE
jgi:hypothetical protein